MNTEVDRDTKARVPPISLTNAAVARVQKLIMQAEQPVLGLRVSVNSKGCSGLSYQVEYATEHAKFDDFIEQDGIKIFIDPTAIMYLLGSKLDYREGKLESGFEFINPNETSRCGCGESFAVKPV